MVRRFAVLFCASLFASTAAAQTAGPEGRWTSGEHVTFTGSKVGSTFFLDITIAADGSFKGTWEEYVCFASAGPYGTTITSCQRSKHASPAKGRLDVAKGEGQIALERLGESAFRFKLAASPKRTLDFELPRDWLKQGTPVLYETRLSPK